jgi:serine/threonine protein kinase
LPLYASKRYVADTNSGDYAFAADIWALGATLFLLLTGKYINDVIETAEKIPLAKRYYVPEVAIGPLQMKRNNTLKKWVKVRSIITACLLENPEERKRIFDNIEYIPSGFAVHKSIGIWPFDKEQLIPLETELTSLGVHL